MRLVSLMSRLIFLLGGLFLVILGSLTLNSQWGIALPIAGIYFMAKGACFLGAILNANG
ncbi:MAG: hypothetical protein ACUVWR_15535 [Anaerolineae bacterium]